MKREISYEFKNGAATGTKEILFSVLQDRTEGDTDFAMALALDLFSPEYLESNMDLSKTEIRVDLIFDDKEIDNTEATIKSRVSGFFSVAELLYLDGGQEAYKEFYKKDCTILRAILG